MKGKFWFKVLAVVALISAAMAYWLQRQEAAQQPPPVQHITTKVKRGDVVHSVLATGSLQAVKTVSVGAQASGEISKLYVKIGDHIKTGDKIAEIDASTQINQRDSEKAALDVSKANLVSAQAKLAEAEHKYKRQQALKDAGTKEALDSARANLTVAKAEVETAKAQIARSELSLKNASVALGHTTVKAPMDGVVIAVAVEEGQSINAVQSTPTIITLAQTSTMTVEGEIAEADVADVKTGMAAYFTLLGSDKTRYEGKLKSIDPAPLATSKNTTTATAGSSDTAVYYYGKMDVPNPDGKLRIGMTANMVIAVEEAKGVLTIPMTALQTNAQGEDEVQVMIDGKPQPRVVKLGINDGVNTEIKEGLKEGEEVVISSGSGEGSIPMGPGGPF